ncbi:MAG TPA: tetratricopeptide repeat protein [Candidatus Angelobacter sp.]|nr:tetratricopeptide repeat protein [Candidatus Angelobacter sp.]
MELRDLSSGTVVNSVYTSASGSFEFVQINAGSYEVVALSGLNECKERIEVSSTPVTLDMRMPVSTRPTDGSNPSVISVEDYKVPEKARNEFRKAQDAAFKSKAADASNHLKKALEIYPNYAAALTLRGLIKLDQKDLSGAMADLQQAIQTDGKYGLAYIGMGAVFNLDSKFDEAIRALERAESLTPNSWQAYFEMGRALIGKSSFAEAIRQLDRAESLAPAEVSLVHLAKAHALMALRMYSDAATELEIYLRKSPSGPNSPLARKMLDEATAMSATAANK